MSRAVPFDVSDVLLDPDWAQEFIVTRYTAGVDSKGRTTESVMEIDGIGVITPSSAEQLQRVPEADRSNEIIAVYSTVQMTSGSDSFKPDVVTWRGNSYRVSSVMDWMDYGAGYSLALCVSTDMQGKEPQ